VAAVRAVLRSALSDAMRRGLIVRNPAALVELPAARKPAPISIDNERLGIWLAHVETVEDPLSPLWLMVAVCGPRRSWTAIDSAQKLIHVTRELLEVAGMHPSPQCGTEHKRLLFDTPKTTAGERMWPLVPVIEAALLAHRLRQDDDRKLYGEDYADHDLVFARPDGTPWSPDWISKQFKATSGAAAGMDRVPPIKALRSTSVTALHEAGVSLEVIDKVIGHAGTQVTKDHYLAVSAERVRSEYEAIATRLGGSDRPGRSDRLSDQHPDSDVSHAEGGEAP
jgi:hypothetical protein